MKKKKLVSIIIVNWNGRQWLPDCFKTLTGQRYKKIEVIFVDNASTDESVVWVKKHYPKTRIVRNKTNLGFAQANNIGYRLAKGEYVLFLNNDTRVTKTFLTELVNVIESDKQIAGVQSKILLMDKPDTYDSIGAFLTPTGFLYHFAFGKKDKARYDKLTDLYTAKGACMMFKSSVLHKVSIDSNIFNPDYFAYFEESDMCHRIWLAGYRIVYAYKSVIYHKMGATSGAMDNAFVQYHSFKNRINSYLKNLGSPALLTIVPVHLFLSLCMAWYMLARGKISLWWAIHRAIWWNIRSRRKILIQRSYIQKIIRKKPDSDFFPIIMKYPSFRYYISFLTGSYDYEESK